jgi:2-polyprenyl-6-methoxyphenol hydroxylase-like FAD-dependent oxidoreductase
MLNRGDYWQCAYVIAKGTFDEMKRAGLPAFREGLLELAPSLGNRTETFKDWSDISLLSVSVDRLREWSRTGLLCVGDSAHAMSPVGGVGINLAIQDAVAAANALVQPLLAHAPLDEPCRAIQKRREFPTKVTQATQVFIHKNFIWPALSHKAPVQKLPLLLRLLQQFPVLRRIPARAVGVGVRPEHIHTPDTHHPQANAAHG